MAERRQLGRPHLVRAELEARPHYAADKAAAANMPPLDFWGLAGWSRRVAEALTGVEVPRYEGPTRTYTAEKTTLYLARNFRRYFEEQLADGRDWACIGREFEEVWFADDAARKSHQR